MTRIRNASDRQSIGAAWLLAAAVLLWAGCGGPKQPRYGLSGKITYEGTPVPRGFILFSPDTARGNDGPGARAFIQNGKYQTLPGQGTIGGPHIATIDAFDGIKTQEASSDPRLRHAKNAGALGKRLFPTVQVTVDLPRQAATHDFVLPVQ
jgi:hypothetical protein